MGWGVVALLLRALSSHETQHLPCSSPVYKPKPCPEVPHVIFCSYSGCTNRSLPLWKVPLWVSELPSAHSHFLLQDLGCIVLSLCVMSGKHVPCCPGSWCSPGRYMSQESGFSVHPSENQKSAFLATVRFQSIFLESVLGLAGSRTAPSALLDPHMAPSALSLHPLLSPHGCLPHCRRLRGGILTPGRQGFYLTHQPSWWTASLPTAELLAASSLRPHG